jgi:predicted small metal-binding protein
VFEFVCEHIVPGCPATERGDTPEAAREKALRHLHEHHDMSYIDDDLSKRIGEAIVRLRV